MNPEVVKVKAEAQKLWDLEQKKPDSKYLELADCIVHVCTEHQHPIFQDNICLCSMLCGSSEEIKMIALLFVNEDEDTIEINEETSILLLPEAGQEALEEGDTIDEVLEAFEDQGATRITIKDLLAAYNKVHGTKHEI